jgi:hypothetical protein
MPRRKKLSKPRAAIPGLKRLKTKNYIPLHVKGLPATDWDVLDEGLASRANYDRGFNTAQTKANLLIAQSTSAAFIAINPKVDGFARPLSTSDVRSRYFPGEGHTNSSVGHDMKNAMNIHATQSVTSGDPQEHFKEFSDGTRLYKPKMFRPQLRLLK